MYTNCYQFLITYTVRYFYAIYPVILDEYSFLFFCSNQLVYGLYYHANFSSLSITGRRIKANFAVRGCVTTAVVNSSHSWLVARAFYFWTGCSVAAILQKWTLDRVSDSSAWVLDWRSLLKIRCWWLLKVAKLPHQFFFLTTSDMR